MWRRNEATEDPRRSAAGLLPRGAACQSRRALDSVIGGAIEPDAASALPQPRATALTLDRSGQQAAHPGEAGEVQRHRVTGHLPDGPPPCAARAWHGRGLVCYARSSERKEASSWQKSRIRPNTPFVRPTALSDRAGDPELGRRL